MQGMLDDAKAQQADNVEKLERAVAKNHDRVKRAEEALAEARQQLAAGATESQPTH
jgi:electron transport complex protein RnfC